MMVAVALSFPPSPPQHSPILGHLASSQTVLRPKARTSFLILLKVAPVGIDVLRYEGRRGSPVLPIRTRESPPLLPSSAAKPSMDLAASSASAASFSRKALTRAEASVEEEDEDEGLGWGVGGGAAVARHRADPLGGAATSCAAGDNPLRVRTLVNGLSTANIAEGSDRARMVVTVSKL